MGSLPMPEIDGIPMNTPSNVFTATYTNPLGVKSTETFTITIAPTPIVPYIQDMEENGGAYEQVSSITANYGDTVNLGPQPQSGGSWSCTGPDEFHVQREAAERYSSDIGLECVHSDLHESRGSYEHGDIYDRGCPHSDRALSPGYAGKWRSLPTGRRYHSELWRYGEPGPQPVSGDRGAGPVLTDSNRVRGS